MDPSPPTRHVPPSELRRLFNELGLYEAVREGHLSIRLKRDRHPSHPKAAEPVCTRSQAVGYIDEAGREIAVVHQYVRRDGSLGASGRPDPKMVMLGDEKLVAD